VVRATIKKGNCACVYMGNNFANMTQVSDVAPVPLILKVCLISTLKKGSEVIKEIWGHWACFRVTTF
jgi:hypothetical protein